MPMDTTDPHAKGPPDHHGKDEEQDRCYQTTDVWRDVGEPGEGHAPRS